MSQITKANELHLEFKEKGGILNQTVNHTDTCIYRAGRLRQLQVK